MRLCSPQIPHGLMGTQGPKHEALGAAELRCSAHSGHQLCDLVLVTRRPPPRRRCLPTGKLGARGNCTHWWHMCRIAQTPYVLLTAASAGVTARPCEPVTPARVCSWPSGVTLWETVVTSSGGQGRESGVARPSRDLKGPPSGEGSLFGAPRPALAAVRALPGFCPAESPRTITASRLHFLSQL